MCLRNCNSQSKPHDLDGTVRPLVVPLLGSDHRQVQAALQHKGLTAHLHRDLRAGHEATAARGEELRRRLECLISDGHGDGLGLGHELLSSHAGALAVLDLPLALAFTACGSSRRILRGSFCPLGVWQRRLRLLASLGAARLRRLWGLFGLLLRDGRLAVLLGLLGLLLRLGLCGLLASLDPRDLLRHELLHLFPPAVEAAGT
mmetsp:Transcript_15456/g.32109  ORF Transcript_15456/g.32109 Transcript_15456/m.32109 type:complete len:203 (+) Transcript_15456:2-610(+)